MDGFGLEAEARMTTWHIMIPSDIEPDGGYSQDISEGNSLSFFPFPAHSLISNVNNQFPSRAHLYIH